jgi:hypothetical protein
MFISIPREFQEQESDSLQPSRSADLLSFLKQSHIWQAHPRPCISEKLNLTDTELKARAQDISVERYIQWALMLSGK